MKKQFLSVLAFTAILLSSCGGTAKIEKASACGQEGEITAFFATPLAAAQQTIRQPPLPRPNQEK